MNSYRYGLFWLVAVVLLRVALSNSLPASATTKPNRVYNMTEECAECAERLACCCGVCMACCSPFLCVYCVLTPILSPCIGTVKCKYRERGGGLASLNCGLGLDCTAANVDECACGGGYWCGQLIRGVVLKSWKLCKWCCENCDKCCGRDVDNSSYPCEASPLLILNPNFKPTTYDHKPSP